MKNALTMEEKVTILNEVDEGLEKKSEIAKTYGIFQSTLSTKKRRKVEAVYKMK